MIGPATALAVTLASSVGWVHVAGWERFAAATTALACDRLELTRRDHLTGRVDVFTGQVACTTPNLVRLRLERRPGPGRESDPANAVALLRNKDGLFVWDFSSKQVTEYRLPDDDAAPLFQTPPVRPILGGRVENLLGASVRRDQFASALVDVCLEPMRRATAEMFRRAQWWAARELVRRCMPFAFLAESQASGQLARRYQVSLDHEDAHHLYLKFTPRAGDDRVEIDYLMLVLTRPGSQVGDYRPALVRVVSGDGRAVDEWKFTDARFDPPGVTANAFRFDPTVPAGWRVNRTRPAGKSSD